MSVISDLINDKSAMIQKITTLDIDDIHTNPLNKAPIINIDELMATIQENGLQTPLIVYKESNHHYVLINGERRYTAIKKLGHTEVSAVIINKPSSKVEERILILDANSQRDETTEYKQARAREYEELYTHVKSEGGIVPGTLKIDWIGQHMSLSGRQVQRLLSSKTKEKTPKEPTDLFEYNELKEYLSGLLETKISFTKNKMSFHFNNTSDLNNILETLGIERKVNE